ncbi:MAG: hypothetical protein R3E79_44500 [Caldilineaceae bacterium]
MGRTGLLVCPIRCGFGSGRRRWLPCQDSAQWAPGRCAILAHFGVDCRPPLRPQLAVEVTEMDSLLKRRLDRCQARQKEQTLSELANRPGISPKVHESLQQVIDALSDALAEIEQAIAELQQRHQPFVAEQQRLLPLPGVGS